MKTKTPAESESKMTELVLPNDTNALGKLMGGRLLHYMDVVGAIAAMRHSNRVCVTASVDSVDFRWPIALGEVFVLEAKLTRAFNTSMEVRIEVYSENMGSGSHRHTNTAFYTFVAVDQIGRPIPVMPLQPVSDEEIVEYENADRRREMRLILAGKLSPEEARYTHTPMKKIL